MDRVGEESVFGRWLRSRRRALDVTQKALATRVGCSVATVRKLESDERRPSRALAAALATALGIPSDEKDAFIVFARGGWADRPPSPRPDLDRPWLAPVPGDRALAAEPAVEASLVATGAGSHRADGTRSVGRDRELLTLSGHMDRALAGAGSVAFVKGEAGQGKSTLLWSFAERAQAEHPDLLVVAGACNAYTGAGDPFQPFREALGELTGDVPSGDDLAAVDRVRAARLQRFVPVALRALLETAPALVGTLLRAAPLLRRWPRSDLGPAPGWVMARATHSAVHEGLVGTGHAALRAGITALLDAVAGTAPVLLILDDLQFLDDSSADALLHLTRSVRTRRLLIVGAYRPADVSSRATGQRHVMQSVLHEVARLHHDAVIDLDGADHRAFLEAWIDTEPNDLGRSFREALWRLTGGQPLFTVELLRAMQERGELARDPEGRWTLVRDVDWTVLPQRVSGVLEDRIDRLGPLARDVLRVASVEGEVFTAEVVARVLELQPRVVTEVVGDELHRLRRLVVPVDMRRGTTGLLSRYRFRHNLIQRHVYESLDEAQRGYLHEAVGTALETLLAGEADPVALADHFLRAQAPRRAAPHLRMAGEHARASGALDKAVTFYRAALEHGPHGASRERAAVQRDLGLGLVALGDVSGALVELERARANFLEAGDADASNAVLAMVGYALYSNSEDERALAACDEAVTALEAAADTRELGLALSMRTQLHMTRDDEDLALADGQRALAIAEALQAEDVRAMALASLAPVLCHDPDRIEAGLAMLSESFRAADRVGLDDFATASLGNQGVALIAVGRFEEGDQALGKALDYAHRHGIRLLESWLHGERWRLAWLRGAWDVALSRAAELEALAGGSMSARDHSQIPNYLALAQLDLGRPEAAAAAHAAIEGGMGRIREESLLVPYHGVRLRIAADLGRSDEADRQAAAMLAVLDQRPTHQIDVVPPVLAACRWLASGPSQSVADGVERCLAVLASMDRRYGAPFARAAWLEARAVAAGQQADAETSADLARAAAADWQTAGFPFDEARARHTAALALARAGRVSERDVELGTTRQRLAALASRLPDGELRRSFDRVRRSLLGGTDLVA